MNFRAYFRINILTYVLLLSLSSIVFANNVVSISNTTKCADRNGVGHHSDRLEAAYCALLSKNYNPKSPEVKKENEIDYTDYTQYDYLIPSVQWPVNQNIKDYKVVPRLWKQRISILIPHHLSEQDKHTALLYITGGEINPQSKSMNTASDSYKNDKIATFLAKQHIVVVVNDVPNQFLTINGHSVKEDMLVANSWLYYFKKPKKSPYIPAQIPMMVASRQAMDVGQFVLKNIAQLKIDHFIVLGLSKRGWATWLTGMTDKRVSAIVPMVIKILNMPDQIKLITNTYAHYWPIALGPYEFYHLNKFTNEKDKEHYKKFLQLIKLIDPYAYIQRKDQAYYQQIKKLKKYMIYASGDDFFVPDGDQFYYNNLPGEKSLYYVPNSPHYLQNLPQKQLLPLLDSINAFINRVLTDTPLPTMYWYTKHNKLIVVLTGNQTPILWTAKNTISRDMRFNCGITWASSEYKGIYGNIGKNMQYLTIENIFKNNDNLKNEGQYWLGRYLAFRDDKDGFLYSTPIMITTNNPANIFPNQKQVQEQMAYSKQFPFCKVVDLKE